MILKIMSFIVWFLVWCGLSLPADRQDLIIGAAVALFVTYLTADLVEGLEDKRPAVSRGIASKLKKTALLLYYAAIFLWECLKANIDVAWRVLHPDPPIRPGTLAVKTSLKSDVALTLLTSSITLTPGTTSVDVDKEKGVLYIHCLYVKDPFEDSPHRLPAVDRFENILKKIFE